MRLHPGQRVLCICRRGQVRSVAVRFILTTLGFKKVIACGWESNDGETVEELCEWADVVLVVGRPSDWKIPTPPEKTVMVEVGEDVWGRYDHPKLLAALARELREIL